MVVVDDQEAVLGHAARSSAESSARGSRGGSGVSATRSRCLRRSPTPGTKGCNDIGEAAENAARSADAAVARYQTTSSRPGAIRERASSSVTAGAVMRIVCAVLAVEQAGQARDAGAWRRKSGGDAPADAGFHRADAPPAGADITRNGFACGSASRPDARGEAAGVGPSSPEAGQLRERGSSRSPTAGSRLSKGFSPVASERERDLAVAGPRASSAGCRSAPSPFEEKPPAALRSRRSSTLSDQLDDLALPRSEPDAFVPRVTMAGRCCRSQGRDSPIGRPAIFPPTPFGV